MYLTDNCFCDKFIIFCKGQLFSATATCKQGKCRWFSKREDIKALLNMDSLMTFSRHMHGCTVPQILCIFFPSLLGCAEAEETHSTTLPALSSVPCLQPSGPRHGSSARASPPAPAPLPKGAAGAPKPEQQSRTWRFAKVFLRQATTCYHPTPGTSSRGTPVSGIYKFQGQSPHTCFLNLGCFVLDS